MEERRDANPELAAITAQFNIARVKREIQKLQETERELWYYNWMGRAMFIVVHALLGLGIWMATREFMNASASRDQAKSAEVQELQLSLEGIALKSSLHGTVLLTIALAFYFCYVKFVYPLVVVP